MKNEKLSRAIGGIDPELINGAEKAAPVRTVGTRKILRTVAITAVATIMILGLLMFNANVRAAVADFIISHDEEIRAHYEISQDDDGYMRVHYESAEEAEPVDIADVTVGYVPEGYVLREIPYEEGEYGYDPNLRGIRVVPESCKDYSEFDLSNNCYDQLVISISRSDYRDPGYSADAYARVQQVKVNDMDAFAIRLDPFNDLVFSDGRITVAICGVGLGYDEMLKIAENIVW